MRVHILRPDVNKYRCLMHARQKGHLEFDLRFDGTPMKDPWSGKERFEFYPQLKLVGDFPGYTGHIPVFNAKAVEALGDLLEGNGELLPITCERQEYFLFNVTRVIDALEEDKCELERFDNGRVMCVERYAFFRDAFIGAQIFKIPQTVLMDVFVTDDFVHRVRSSGLRGFDFRLVWSDHDNV